MNFSLAIITNICINYEERGVEIGRSVTKSMSSRVGRSSTEVNQNRKRGMVLPFEPLSITFDDIKYAVDMPQVYICLQLTSNGTN